MKFSVAVRRRESEMTKDEGGLCAEWNVPHQVDGAKWVRRIHGKKMANRPTIGVSHIELGEEITLWDVVRAKETRPSVSVL